jgi:hypothetical protein
VEVKYNESIKRRLLKYIAGDLKEKMSREKKLRKWVLKRVTSFLHIGFVNQN